MTILCVVVQLLVADVFLVNAESVIGVCVAD